MEFYEDQLKSHFLNILFHDDWEIYGDGTGDPEILMFDPANRLMDICDSYGAKYTFFVEIGQQLNMLSRPGTKWHKYAVKWEKIVKDAISRGHDVQLHLHPQWIGAFWENGRWQLNLSEWHSGYVNPDLLTDWIGKGKLYLENLLRSTDKDYRVLSFRAGGWFCQPSNGLYLALRKNGIICDISVMKGRYRKYEGGKVVDFRNAVSCYEPWEVDPENFAREQTGSGVWELPVFTEISSLPHPVYLLKKAFRPWHYYKIFQKRKKRKGAGGYSPKVIPSEKSKEYYGSFGYMHVKHLMSYINHLQEISCSNIDVNHLIFLTHSKSFLDFKNFENLLKRLSLFQEIQFSTTRNYIQQRMFK